MLVISYLNNRDINQHLGNSMTDMTEELQVYSDRYNAVHDDQIDLASLHRDYIHNVLLPRINGVRDWLTRRLSSLQIQWGIQNINTPDNPVVVEILAVIESRMREVNTLELDSSRLPGPNP